MIALICVLCVCAAAYNALKYGYAERHRDEEGDA